MTGPVRPERGYLLELIALLETIERLVADGDIARFHADDHYRWVVERLWIAVGNEAFAYGHHVGQQPLSQPSRRLVELRNELAHRRLPDIDTAKVWRISLMRPRSLADDARSLLT